jgi:hypothetical protein
MDEKEQKLRVERIRELKKQQALLSEEQKELESSLPEQVIYLSDKPEDREKPWIRWTRIDNIAELLEKGQVFRSNPFNRHTTKIESLKNMPKELS